jgi:DNA polymerase III sliding clamp (beta) subunit (PCNA family)
MIKIPTAALKAARKLLTRIPFTRCNLPVLGHVLARTDADSITLAVTDLDVWLETIHSAANWEDFPDRPSVEGPAAEIPAATFEALRAVAPCASRDEKRQVLGGVLFSPEGWRDQDDRGILTCRTLEGIYPAYKQVIPNECPAAVSIPKERRAALIKWLRSLRGSDVAVQLSATKPRELTLVRCGSDRNAATPPSSTPTQKHTRRGPP